MSTLPSASVAIACPVRAGGKWAVSITVQAEGEEGELTGAPALAMRKKDKREIVIFLGIVSSFYCDMLSEDKSIL